MNFFFNQLQTRHVVNEQFNVTAHFSSSLIAVVENNKSDFLFRFEPLRKQRAPVLFMQMKENYIRRENSCLSQQLIFMLHPLTTRIKL